MPTTTATIAIPYTVLDAFREGTISRDAFMLYLDVLPFDEMPLPIARAAALHVCGDEGFDANWSELDAAGLFAGWQR